MYPIVFNSKKSRYVDGLGQFKKTNFFLISLLLAFQCGDLLAQSTPGLALFQIESALDISYNLTTSVSKKLHLKSDTGRISEMDKKGMNKSFDSGTFVQRYDVAGATEVLYSKQASSTITPSDVKHQVIRGNRAYYYNDGLSLVEDVEIATAPIPLQDVQALINDYLQSEQERRTSFANDVNCMRGKGAEITNLPDKINIKIVENGRKHNCFFTYEGRPLERFTTAIEDNRIIESEKYTYTLNTQNLVVPQLKIRMELQKLPDSVIPIEVYWHESYSNYLITLSNYGNFAIGREADKLKNNGDAITIMPNIAKDFITVLGNFENSEGSIAKIIDLNGTVRMQMVTNSNSFTMDLPQLSNGLYVLQVENQGKTLSGKFTIHN